MKKIAIVLIAGLLLFWLPACQADPEAEARAKIALLQAQRIDAATAIQQQWDQARADIQAKATAEMELAKDKAALEIETQQKINQIKIDFQNKINESNARFNARIAEINRATNLNNAISIGGVILITGVSIALVLMAFGAVTWVRNRAHVVTVGTTSLIVTGDQIFAPENDLNRYTAVEKVPRWARFLIWLGTVWEYYKRVKNASGAEADGNPGSPWDIIDRARLALQPHLSSDQVQNPQEVAQLRLAQLQSQNIKALAEKMSGNDARSVAETLEVPKPAGNITPLEVGWLPAPNANAYELLETEGK